jgi:hypothetical protein
VGAQAPTPLKKEAVAKAIASIESGLTDPYLRALWEAIAARKAALEATGELPPQQKVDPAEVKWQIDHDLTPDTTPGHGAVVNAPVPVIDQQPTGPSTPTRVRRKPKSSNLGHVSARPVSGGPQLQSVMPLTRAMWSTMADTSYFHHRGLAYSKADFKGAQVQGQTSHGDLVTFQIVGVGDKSIKCLIVTEPPQHAVSGKTNLHQKWAANEPVFMPHALIEPWLMIPADLTTYV